MSALDQRVLGDDGAGMVAFGEQFQRGPGQPPAFLDRLIGVGVAADVDRADHIARLGQLPAQDIGEVTFRPQFGFEIETRRQVEIAVRRSRKTIDTAVLATAVRVDRLSEMDIRRIVAADHAARAFLGDLGARARAILVEQLTRPAVIFGVVPDALKATFGIGRGAAPLDLAADRGAVGRGQIIHGPILPFPCLSRCDIRLLPVVTAARAFEAGL